MTVVAAPPAAVPESHGLDCRVLLRTLTALEEGGLDPHGFAIARDGVVLASGTWAPWNALLPGQVYSVSKTFVSLAVGHLVAEGRLALADDVAVHLPYANPAGIIVSDLLAMTTGHTPDQLAPLGPPYATSDLLSVPPVHPPGTFFAYSSLASFALSELVTAVTGQRLIDYLRPRVLAPLGIGDRWWIPQGPLDQGYAGLHLTLGDLTRLGIALSAGRTGDSTVIPPAWLDALARPATDNAHHDPSSPDFSSGYGLQVWMSRHGYRADGAYGQFCLTVPERNLAIAYLGATRNVQAALRIWWELVESLAERALPENPAAAADLAERLATLDSWRSPIAVDPAPLAHQPAPRLWSVTARPHVWGLTLGDLAIDISEGEWRHQDLPVPLPMSHRRPSDDETGHLLVAARGAAVDDGVEIHLVVPTSPHRLVVRGRGSAVHLAWHTVPLWQPTLTALAVPDLVVTEHPPVRLTGSAQAVAGSDPPLPPPNGRCPPDDHAHPSLLAL